MILPQVGAARVVQGGRPPSPLCGFGAAAPYELYTSSPTARIRARRQLQLREARQRLFDRPRAQGASVHDDRAGGSGHGHPLAEVDRGAKLCHRLLPREDLVGSCAPEQPRGERRFPLTRPRRREQFEHRRLSEQIEIQRVGVVLVAEAPARLAGADPPVLESREAALVVRDGRRGSASGAKDALVPCGEHQERCHWARSGSRA